MKLNDVYSEMIDMKERMKMYNLLTRLNEYSMNKGDAKLIKQYLKK